MRDCIAGCSVGNSRGRPAVFEPSRMSPLKQTRCVHGPSAPGTPSTRRPLRYHAAGARMLPRRRADWLPLRAWLRLIADMTLLIGP